MGTWREERGWAFDLQRFADSTATMLVWSEITTIEGFETGNKLKWDEGTGAWVVDNDNGTIAYNKENTADYTLTFADGQAGNMTVVYAAAASEGTLKITNSDTSKTVTVKNAASDEVNGFTVAASGSAKVGDYTADGGYTLATETTGTITLTAGKTVYTADTTNNITVNDGTSTIVIDKDGLAATDTFTFAYGTGITAADVTANAYTITSVSTAATKLSSDAIPTNGVTLGDKNLILTAAESEVTVGTNLAVTSETGKTITARTASGDAAATATVNGVTLGAGTDDSTASQAIIAADGTVTGLTDKSTVSGVPENKTVTTAAEGAFSINGKAVTTAANVNTKFTAATEENGGFSKVEGIGETESTLTFEPTANKTVTIGTDVITMSTPKEIVVTATSDDVSGVATSDAEGVFTGVKGTYTINTKDFTGTYTDGITVTSGAGGTVIASVTGLGADEKLTAFDGSYTVNDVAITIGADGSTAITVNGSDTATEIGAIEGLAAVDSTKNVLTVAQAGVEVSTAAAAGEYSVNGKTVELEKSGEAAVDGITLTTKSASTTEGFSAVSNLGADEQITFAAGDDYTVNGTAISLSTGNSAGVKVVGAATGIGSITGFTAESEASKNVLTVAQAGVAIETGNTSTGTFSVNGTKVIVTVATDGITMTTKSAETNGGISAVSELGTGDKITFTKGDSYTVNGKTITLTADDSTVTVAGATEADGSIAISALAADNALTVDAANVAVATAAAAGTYTVNGESVTIAEGTGSIAGVTLVTESSSTSGGIKAVTGLAATDKITGFKGGYTINGKTITVGAGDADGIDITLDGSDFKITGITSGVEVTVEGYSFVTADGETELTVTADGKLKEGTVTVKDTLALSGGKGNVTVSGANDGVKVVVSSGEAQNITGLEPTEIVSYDNKTYQAVSDTTLSINDGSETKLYDISSTGAIASLDVLSQDFSSLPSTDVATDGSWATTNGNYSMAGVKDGTPVAFTVTNASASNSNPTVTVNSAVTAGVFDLTATTALSSVTFKDSNTGTVYKLSDKSSVKLNGTLNASKDGVLTSGSGTVAAASGTITTKTSAPAFDVSQGGTLVLFSSGTSLSSTAVTTEKGTIKITESSNTTDTTVASDGKVSGIDGNATVTGAVTDQTITTTGDGTVSINGTSWTVTGSTNGVTYTADANTKGKVSSIKDSAGNDLAKGTTISTTNDISGSTVNGITVNSATKGLSMTQTDTGASVTLSNSGDEITNAKGTFKANAAGNGVTISPEGTVSGLTDGEKVTVTNGTTETVYEVTGNTLVTTQTTGVGTGSEATKTYTSILADGETDGFTVALAGTTATNAAKEADKTTATNGLSLGGTQVNEVTTGMMVDASGNATTSSQKAVAEVTILNDGDEIKYTSKQDKKQTVAVAAGDAAANKEWDITTGGGSDAITFAGAKDATINAGNGNNEIRLNNTGDVSVAAGSGNDKVTIGGAGDALVSVAGGRNVISHTGTGTASIAGGTGNDTISSSNEDDLIYGGAGNNTFKTTAGVTNKISDFTFGADKAALAGVTGALDASQVVVGTDGTIAYGDKATSGALDVSAEGFDGFYAVSIADQDGKHKLNVGWTGENGGMINASGLTEKALLIGNSEGRADTLMGGSAGDTLKAGTGDSSLWGGAGNDTLVSSTEASTSFFFLAGDGQDRVQGFKAYTEDTKDTADTLDFYGQGISSVMLTDSGIKVTKGTDSMTLVGSYDANTMIQWKNGDAKGVAKVGKNAETNSFTYDSAVTNYLGGTKTDTVAVSDDGMGVNVWMDGSQGVGYDSIEVLDASSVTGKATLAGGAGSNTITGGQGESSLWGGADGSDDVLNAGSGTNTFFYGLGNGNDVVNGTKEGDTVNLFNLNLSDLTSAVIEDSKITVTQANGQTLTVNGQANTFTLADGSTWQADHSTKTWRQNS